MKVRLSEEFTICVTSDVAGWEFGVAQGILGNLAWHALGITQCSVITQQRSCEGTEQWSSVKRTENQW